MKAWRQANERERELNAQVEILWTTAAELDVAIGSTAASEWVWLHARRLFHATTEEALAEVPKLTAQLRRRLDASSTGDAA